MSTRAPKRPRAATNEDCPPTTSADSPLNDAQIAALVQSLEPDAMRSLLTVAAQKYPAVADLVHVESIRLAKVEKEKVIDFDYLSKSAWRTLNVTYDRMRDSAAFQMSGEAYWEVKGCMKSIADRCPKAANFRTKKSALETLRKIGKSICLSDGVIGREVRQSFQSDHTLVDTMQRIAKSLSKEEAETLVPWCEEK